MLAETTADNILEPLRRALPLTFRLESGLANQNTTPHLYASIAISIQSVFFK